MDTKHTPGPWYPDPKGYVWRRPLKDLYEYGGAVAGDKPIATVVKGWYGEGEQGYPIEANARLIAAAPDLLEALYQIFELPEDSRIAYKIARKAILKATGGDNVSPT